MAHNKKMDTGLWMVTFSDLVMLLLTFFVLLLSMSSMDARKLQDMFTHFRAATGVLGFAGSGAVSDLAKFIHKLNKTDTMVVVDHTLLERLVLTDLDQAIMKMMLKNDQTLTIEDDARGIVLKVTQDILFEHGQTVLDKKVLPVLDLIAKAIADSPNEILIMGHTDNVAVSSSRYSSNWELSAYRGLAVLQYFIVAKGLPASRFAVGGYGPSRPLKPSDTPENRALNRRVEIIFRHLGEV